MSGGFTPCWHLRPSSGREHNSDQKGEIFSNINKHRNNQAWRGVHLDDISPNQQAVRRDARSIVALARAKALNCKQNGSSVILDGVKYNPRDFDSLPHGISLESAKIISVDDGLAFQGHHAYLSNMHATPVPYSGCIYPSAESAYQSTCASFHGHEGLALQIELETDPYTAKNSPAVSISNRNGMQRKTS